MTELPEVGKNFILISTDELRNFADVSGQKSTVNVIIIRIILYIFSYFLSYLRFSFYVYLAVCVSRCVMSATVLKCKIISAILGLLGACNVVLCETVQWY